MMVKSYRYQAKGTKYILIENKTEYIIRKGTKDNIQKLASHLNAGGGFNGETPKFFLNQKEQKI